MITLPNFQCFSDNVAYFPLLFGQHSTDFQGFRTVNWDSALYVHLAMKIISGEGKNVFLIGCRKSRQNKGPLARASCFSLI